MLAERPPVLDAVEVGDHDIVEVALRHADVGAVREACGSAGSAVAARRARTDLLDVVVGDVVSPPGAARRDETASAVLVEDRRSR